MWRKSNDLRHASNTEPVLDVKVRICRGRFSLPFLCFLCMYRKQIHGDIGQMVHVWKHLLHIG
jgi:hypothetical protein